MSFLTPRDGAAGALVALALSPLSAQAVDWSFSGFGTLGWAQSNRAEAYERFITEEGSLKRDSVLGGQLDARLSPAWSATVQATVAPSLSTDDTLAVSATWAFVSWRPDNDWLVRLGKQRIPLFLNTENRDVGQTYDFLRLPTEVYAIAPSTDFNGLSLSHTWLSDQGEWTFDAYSGSGRLSIRSQSRDLGVSFLPVHLQASGAALTLRTDDASTWRASYYRASSHRNDGQPLAVRFPYVGAGGYYQVDPSLPGPGIPTTPGIVNDLITLGADVAVAPNWQVVGEWVRNIQHKTDLGTNTVGGYVAVLHRIERYTPYISVARLRSMGPSLQAAQDLNAAAATLSQQGAAQLALSQRAAADGLRVYDQTTVAVGLSYALTPSSKLKGEWLRSHIGLRSAMVDSPPGVTPVNHASIDVLSLAYSVAF